MNDLIRAKTILEKENHTCVLVKGDKVITSDKKGISPILDFISGKIDLKGFCVADKIVGKAAAMLFSKAGIIAVYGEVMSNTGLNYLKARNIPAEYNTLCERIINRKGDGICPMEMTVADITDEEIAFGLLLSKRNELMSKKGESMKKLGFGFMRLPLLDGNDQTSFDKEQICKMVDEFIEKGFTYFDTAYMYHEYKSENVIKEVLVDRYERSRFKLATKMPTMYLKEKDDLERIFNEQLEKTGAGYFDYYLLHCLNTDNYATTQRLEGFQFALKKKAEGKIKKLGFSFHDNAKVLDKILTEHPETEFVQLQINYLDWENPYVQSRLCYEVARKHGKEIIVMEPVKGGVLANVPDAVKSLFNKADGNLSVASWAVRYAASLEGVIMVLSGMSNLSQLRDNTCYMENFKPLNDEEIKLCFKAADIINSSIAIACTKCRYCVDGCPQNISIPDYFELYNKLAEENPDTKALMEEYKEYTKTFGKAGDCIECKQCESHCPQHIKIVDSLKRVKEKFE